MRISAQLDFSLLSAAASEHPRTIMLRPVIFLLSFSVLSTAAEKSKVVALTILALAWATVTRCDEVRSPSFAYAPVPRASAETVAINAVRVCVNFMLFKLNLSNRRYFNVLPTGRTFPIPETGVNFSHAFKKTYSGCLTVGCKQPEYGN